MLAVRDIRKGWWRKDARDAAADREGMSRAFHAAVLDVGEVDYTAMFHVKHWRMPRLSLLAVRVAMMVLLCCDIHDPAAVERCSVYISCSVLGAGRGGIHVDVSRETSEELARVIRNMRIVGSLRAEVPR